MMPMVNTATIMRPKEWELPFWNSSHTNFPKPGFCANISAAINTIQPTPKDKRKPVKIRPRDEGNTNFVIFVNQPNCNTLPTFIKSLSIDDTPTAVLIKVGHNEHKVTVMAEFKNDFANHASSSEVT